MERKIGKELHLVSNKLCRRIDQIVNQCSLTHSQFAVMLYMIKNSGKDVFQRDIEEEFGIRRSSVSAILSHLEEKGYIVRSSVLHDARLKKISTTAGGEKMVEEATRLIRNFESMLLSEISEDELEIFYKVLFKIAEVVDRT